MMTRRRQRGEVLVAPLIPLKKKMTRRKQRGEDLVAPEIPLDLHIEILKRLPVKSLARFKCVSKLWSSLIHFQGYLFPSPPRLFIIWLKMAEVLTVHSFSALLSNNKSSTVFDLDLKKAGIEGYNMVVLRGLILYYVTSKEACIYNPTTGQRVTLPAINILAEEEIKKLGYLFGYDPILDQYKVVWSWSVKHERRSYTQHWVFVLEAGSSWKKIEYDHPCIHSTSRQGVCINGVIYYFAFADCSGYRRIVISFNVRSEEFNMIQLPSVVYGYLNSWHLELIEYNGKPTIFDHIHEWDQSGLLNLWVLEDTGKWSKKSLVLQPCQMHFFSTTISFEVIGTTQNGEVVLKPHQMMPYSSYILYY